MLMGMKSVRRTSVHAVWLAAIGFVIANVTCADVAFAQCAGNTCTVTIASDPGTSATGTTGAAGTLSYALAYANAQSSPVTINIETSVTLSGALSPIFNSVTINGNGNTISGGGTERIFFIGVDHATQTSAAVAGSIVAQTQNVAISNLTLANAVARGGAGGDGGGGGMGAGGALFVNQSANVTLTGVSFNNNSAVGGAGVAGTSGGGGGLGGAGGATNPAGLNGGGGGGLFGAGGGGLGNGNAGGGGIFGTGGIGYPYGGGGGGYTGAGGGPDSNGQDGHLGVSGLTGKPGGNGTGTTGGAQGGGGGGTISSVLSSGSGGGGGFGGQSGNGTLGGAGGFGGGGGGPDVTGNGQAGAAGGFGGGGSGAIGYFPGGSGGFGGGGGGIGGSGFGGTGGSGGFGGGGGAAGYGSASGVGGQGGFGGGGGSGPTAGQAGFGAGDGGSAGGGGGAAMGGAVFVAKGGTLTINGSGSTTGSAATGGSGANTGSAFGGGFFLQGSALTIGAGNYTIADVIADQNGSGGSNAANGFGGTGGQSSITKSGTGTLTLSAANTYTGGTFVNGGTLTLSHQTNGVIDAAGTGGISFTGTAGALRTGLTATLSNTITSNANTTGTIAVATGQTLTFNGILYQHGNLIFGSATDQGTVIWSAPGELLYGGTVRIAGGTLKAGSSPLGNALGDMTYVAQTTVDAGAMLDFSNQSGSINNLHGAGNVTAGTGLLTLINGGDFSGTISGSGGLKLASGTLTLSGNNTYTGATTVNGGVLDVEGSITGTSSVTVNAGGTLTGTGLVDPLVVTIAAGGALAPGNGTAGTSLAIEGNLALQSGAIYLVQVNPSTASFASITGTAALGGATVNAVFASGSYVSKQYTILTAGNGITGSFGSLVDTNLPANFRTTLSYDANDAYLNLALNFAIPGGLNGNQQAVGNGLTNFFNANGGIPLIYGALTPAGLTQASGESGTGSQQTTFAAMSQFMGVLTDPFAQRDGGPGAASGTAGFVEEDQASAYAARKRTDAFAMVTKASPQSFAPRWSVWAAGFGGSQTTDGNAAVGSNDTTSRIAGTAVGADYRLSPTTLLGFALAGGGTSFGVNGLGSGRSDLFQAGAYLRHSNGPTYISAALAYGWQNITTDRTVTIAGADRLRAAFDANAYSGRIEGGYRFVAPWIGGVGFTPYGAAQFTTLDLPAYAEQVISGSTAFALSYAAKTVTDTRSELGLRSDKSFAVRDGVLTLRGRLAWAHDFNPDRSIATTFQALPGASFVVNGAAQASDSALTTASLEMNWLNGWSAAASFEGEFSNVTRSYAGKGSVRYAW